MIRLSGAAAEQVETFCDSLKKSLLEAVRRGDGIHLQLDHDTEPVGGYPSDVPADHAWMGCTYTVRVGRPARAEIFKDQEQRAALLGRLRREKS